MHLNYKLAVEMVAKRLPVIYILISLLSAEGRREHILYATKDAPTTNLEKRLYSPRIFIWLLEFMSDSIIVWTSIIHTNLWPD
jgi:hypothetical protein